MMNFNSYIPMPKQNHISTWVDLVIAMFLVMAYITSCEAHSLLLRIVKD